MKKYIIQDFFEAFKIYKHNKQQGINYEILTLCFCMYFVCIWTNLSKGESRLEWKMAVTCAAVLLPMLFTYYSIYIHPPKLGKMMYLCPMSPEERREYIYGSYFFRIGFHMLIAIAGLCIAILIFYCDIFSAIQILLNHIMLAALASFTQKKDGGKDNAYYMEIFILSLALISNLVEYGIIVDEEPDTAIKIVLFIVFCVIQAPLEIVYIKHLKRELKNAVFYENRLKN